MANNLTQTGLTIGSNIIKSIPADFGSGELNVGSSTSLTIIASSKDSLGNLSNVAIGSVGRWEGNNHSGEATKLPSAGIWGWIILSSGNAGGDNPNILTDLSIVVVNGVPMAYISTSISTSKCLLLNIASGGTTVTTYLGQGNYIFYTRIS